METTKFIWHNGKIVPWEEANVHILTHTLHYSAGAFEGIRFYQTPQGHAIFRLEDHIDRFIFSANVLKMKMPYSKEEIISAVKEVVVLNNLKEGYIRPIIYYGYGIMGVNPTGAPVGMSIACWPWTEYLKAPLVNIKTSSFIRLHKDSTIPEAKLCGHYLNSIMARLEIQGTEYHEALLLDSEGNIAEGSGENIFIVKNGVLYTPGVGCILPGITRKTIMEIATNNNIKVVETSIKLEDVYNADEAFFTGTAVEVKGIRSLDDKVLGQGEKIGPITQKLSQEYSNIVHGKNAQYMHYLTQV